MLVVSEFPQKTHGSEFKFLQIETICSVVHSERCCTAARAEKRVCGCDSYTCSFYLPTEQSDCLLSLSLLIVLNNWLHLVIAQHKVYWSMSVTPYFFSILLSPSRSCSVLSIEYENIHFKTITFDIWKGTKENYVIF